jgi:hypothetical protein
MAMTQYTGDTDIITNIGTNPEERGLTTSEFKAKFDEALKAFVLWFNNTHKTEFNALATKTELNTLTTTVGTKMPISTASAGAVGELKLITGITNSPLLLPAGGTWEYFTFYIDASTAAMYGTLGSMNASVAAGGTQIIGAAVNKIGVAWIRKIA